MKRLLAVLCVCALMLAAFAGCAGQETAQTQTEAPDETQTDTQTETPPEAQAEAPAQTVTPAAEESQPEPGAQEAREPAAPAIAYPLEQAVELSVFFPQDSMAFMIMNELGLEQTWDSIPTLGYVYDQVNFTYRFMSPGEAASTEQFNLMIASGAWTDLFEGSLYTGGTTQALTDEVILDLTDLIGENMPDYWALVREQTPEDQALLYNDDQQILSVNDIYGSRPVSSGLLMRQDMLEAVGLDAPQTTQALYEALKAVHTAYATPQTFFVDPDGVMGSVVGAFGTAGFDVTGATANPGFYLRDGTVQTALRSDGYYDYLQYFSQLYREGLIYEDFYTQVRSASLMNSLSLGSAFIWNGDGGLIDSMTETGKQDLPEYQLCGIGAITQDADETYQFASSAGLIETGGTCVTTTCKNPAAALQVLNWYFTQAGRQYCVWGVEDVSFTYDAAGAPTFTQAVTDGVYAINPMSGFYMWSPCALYIDKDNVNAYYSDTVVSAYALWSDCSDACTLPGLSLTTEESEEYNGMITDLCTIAGEQVLKWALGAEELTPEAWDSFGEGLDSLCLDRCTEIYQTAYARYLSRIG